MPTPRLTPQMRKTQPRRVPAEQGGSTITTEPVSVASGGGYLIRGTPTPARAALTVNEGDLVSVLWKHGKPFMILDMQSRHGPATDEVFGGPIVEDLFIAPDTGGTVEVWFRNAGTVANLKLRSDWPADPDQVRWGARADSFFVRVGYKYFIYKFSRPGGIDHGLTSAPKPKLLRAENAWDTNALISTITYEATIDIETPCVWTDIDDLSEPFGPPIFFHDTQIHTSGAAATISQAGLTNTQTTEVRVTQTSIENGRIVIFDAQLDWKYNLILSLRIQLSSIVTKPSGSFFPIKDKTYARREVPPGNIVSETGDPTACNQQSVLDTTPSTWTAQQADPDYYTAIVNVTDQVVLWSTLKPTPTLVFDEGTQDGVGAASHYHELIDTHGIGDNEIDIACTQAGTPNFDPVQATIPPDPGNFNLPSSIETIEYTARKADTLYAHDFGVLSWLTGVPDLVTTVSVNTTRYGSNSFGFRGTYDNVNPIAGQLSQVVIAGHFTGDQNLRTAQLLIWPLRFHPHRTKVGGVVYLFIMVLTFNTQGALTAQKYSVWSVDIDTNKGTQVSPWTTIPSANSFVTGTVIDASLRHVMWLVTVESGGDTTWIITLSDATNGAQKVVATGVTGGFSNAMPPTVAAFLARHWKLPRPDLLYLLDDADKTKTEKFINGWSKTVVTLDPADLKLDAALSGGVGKLKKLPTGVVPDSSLPDPFNPETTPDRRASVRVLESHSALKGRFLTDP